MPFVRRIPPPPRQHRQRGKFDIVHVGGVVLGARDAAILREYLRDFNASHAAIRAGIDPKVAGSIGHQTMRKPVVVQALHHELERRRRRVDASIDEVARYWYDLATADAREFVPVKWLCCRHCWGIDNRRQFTRAEMIRALRAFKAKHGDDPDAEFDEMGGPGFDAKREPNPECQECHGVGEQRRVPIDLDNLSRGAALLFDGMEVTQHANGAVTTKIRLRDRSEAMRRFAEMVGFAPHQRNRSDEELLDALISEAVARGLIRPDEVGEGAVDVTPRRPRVIDGEVERVA